MFDEEKQDSGVELMTAMGFPMGRLLYPLTSEVYPNSIVSTVEDGEFWYGDISLQDMAKLHMVAKALDRALIVESKTQPGHGFRVNL